MNEAANKLALELEALNSLRRSDGWQAFLAYLKSQKAGVEGQMRELISGDQGMKACGALVTLNACAAWLDSTIELKTRALERERTSNERRDAGYRPAGRGDTSIE